MATITPSELKNELIQNVVILLYNSKVLKEPMLKFLKEDRGIFDTTLNNYFTDPSMLALRDEDENIYHRVIACHFFGLGVLVRAEVNRIRKHLEDWGEEDVRSFGKSICETDIYEQALSVLHFDINH